MVAIQNCITPLSTDKPVCYGLDLAKSVDWTCLIGLDSKRRVCVIERFQRPWNDTIIFIRDKVGNTPTLVHSTGVGDAVLESLQMGGRRNFEGFKFTQGSKQQLMEGLAVAIQKQEIGFPDGVIVKNQLESFEYEYTRTGVSYAAAQGMHDDTVCALALAQSKARSYRPKVIIEMPNYFSQSSY